MEGDRRAKEDGLPAGWTRATLIVRADLLDKLKDHAWTERRTIKDVVEEMMTQYLADKDPLQRKK